jgi:CRP/FNR family transcriptional regulator
MEIREVLRLVAIFRDLNAEEMDRVAGIAATRLARKKSVLFMEGDDKETVYFIQDGLVKTYKTDANGNEQIVSILQTGDMFPHTGFFNQTPYPATAETLVDTQLVAIPIRAFERLILEVPTIAMKVIDALGAKIRELQQKLQQFAGRDVHERILSLLLQLADKHGLRKGTRICIELPVTHQELAHSIGTTRETVNRLLSQLKKQGILETNRSEMVIRDLEALKQWKDLIQRGAARK